MPQQPNHISMMLSYERWLNSPDGEVCLEDMEHTFIDCAGDEVQATLADIPHPYRAYFAQGMAYVVRCLKAIGDRSERELIVTAEGDSDAEV